MSERDSCREAAAVARVQILLNVIARHACDATYAESVNERPRPGGIDADLIIRWQAQMYHARWTHVDCCIVLTRSRVRGSATRQMQEPRCIHENRDRGTDRKKNCFYAFRIVSRVEMPRSNSTKRYLSVLRRKERTRLIEAEEMY